MSGDCQREMTLDEWVERLPEIHRARKEYAALKAEVEKFTSTNNARDEICASCRLEILYKHEKVFHSSEFRFCPWCGRKLSPVA